MLSFRKDIRAAVEEARFDDLEELVIEDRGAVRHLLGLTYAADDTVAGAAAKGLAIAARHHAGLVQSTLRRLIWAMNDESATNALSAPRVFVAVAEEHPQLLLPMVPDLMRLRSDEGLRDGLERALTVVAESCPDGVPRLLHKQLPDSGGKVEPR
jgi:hypothetical protein